MAGRGPCPQAARRRAARLDVYGHGPHALGQHRRSNEARKPCCRNQSVRARRAPRLKPSASTSSPSGSGAGSGASRRLVEAGGIGGLVTSLTSMGALPNPSSSPDFHRTSRGWSCCCCCCCCSCCWCSCCCCCCICHRCLLTRSCSSALGRWSMGVAGMRGTEGTALVVALAAGGTMPPPQPPPPPAAASPEAPPPPPP